MFDVIFEPTMNAADEQTARFDTLQAAIEHARQCVSGRKLWFGLRIHDIAAEEWLTLAQADYKLRNGTAFGPFDEAEFRPIVGE